MFILKHLNIYSYISKYCGSLKNYYEDYIRCNNGKMIINFTGVMTPIKYNSIEVIPLTGFYIINLLFKIN